MDKKEEILKDPEETVRKAASSPEVEIAAIVTNLSEDNQISADTDIDTSMVLQQRVLSDTNSAHIVHKTAFAVTSTPSGYSASIPLTMLPKVSQSQHSSSISIYLILRICMIVSMVIYLLGRHICHRRLDIGAVEYTVRVNTFRRLDLLEKFLEHYVTCPDITEIQVLPHAHPHSYASTYVTLHSAALFARLSGPIRTILLRCTGYIAIGRAKSCSKSTVRIVLAIGSRACQMSLLRYENSLCSSLSLSKTFSSVIPLRTLYSTRQCYR